VRIFETFSKRKKKQEKAGQPEIYQYDNLPEPFRVQVIHIWQDINTNIKIGYEQMFSSSFGQMGSEDDEYISRLWEDVFNLLTREKGVFQLSKQGNTCLDQCQSHLLQADTDDALDLIEASFRIAIIWLNHLVQNSYLPKSVFETLNDLVEELNYRFREHGIGYQFEGGQIIRIDSQYVHAEAVRPALSLLHEAGFDGASDEFLRAHEHYQHSRYKEAIVEALKSFESTMKTICDLRKWAYPSNAAAQKLIDVILTNELLPRSLESQLAAIRSLMESSLPTIRNKTSGHGQGKDPVDVPGYFAAFALHLAASNIVFLVEAHKAKK